MNPHRRIFMKHAGLCGMGAALYLAGCGGDSEPAAKDTAKAVAARMNAETCTDLSELTSGQIKIRDTFGYVDRSDDADMICRTCEFWKAPAAGVLCGGCTLMAGPIHPEGFCDSYSEA